MNISSFCTVSPGRMRLYGASAGVALSCSSNLMSDCNMSDRGSLSQLENGSIAIAFQIQRVLGPRLFSGFRVLAVRVSNSVHKKRL